MSAALAPETFSASQTDAQLAAVAGVPEEAVRAFRRGVPHWSLDGYRVVDSLATATGNDPGAVRAALSSAKARALGLRAHGIQGPRTFPGQTYPSMRD